MASKRGRVLRSVHHMWLIYSVLQCSRLRSASPDVVNRDLNPVLAEKGVIASGKSHSYTSFAFSCSRTLVTRTSFSCCCQKHGDRRPRIQIIENSDIWDSDNWVPTVLVTKWLKCCNTLILTDTLEPLLSPPPHEFFEVFHKERSSDHLGRSKSSSDHLGWSSSSSNY